MLAALESQRPTGLVIRSAKKSGFIAGADVNEFRGASDARAVETEIGRAHAVIDRLEALRVPTVAVIHGFCLGGGLEVALACQMRIAIDDARFGFPEVMLGLHPGLGGTVRFTRAGQPDAGDDPDADRQDHRCAPRQIARAGRCRDAGAPRPQCGEGRRVRPAEAREAGCAQRAAQSRSGARLPRLAHAHARPAKAAPHEHYPAPYALIDLWEKHGGDRAAMLSAEKASFANLMVTPTAQNLIRVFFLREQMKKLAGSGNKIEHVHVIGAGAMGGDIAAWCASQDMRVTLADMKAEPIAGAIKRAAELFGKIMRKRTDQRAMRSTG